MESFIHVGDIVRLVHNPNLETYIRGLDWEGSWIREQNPEECKSFMDFYYKLLKTDFRVIFATDSTGYFIGIVPVGEPEVVSSDGSQVSYRFRLAVSSMEVVNVSGDITGLGIRMVRL